MVNKLNIAFVLKTAELDFIKIPLTTFASHVTKHASIVKYLTILIIAQIVMMENFCYMKLQSIIYTLSLI